MNEKIKDEVIATLAVYKMQELSRKEIRRMIQWLTRLAKEMGELEPEAYTKNPKFRLMKQVLSQ